MNEARDRYATEHFNQPYKSLPQLYQTQIDKMPDIQQLQGEADKRALQLGNKLGNAFIERRHERDDARFVYETNLNNYQKVVDGGVISPSDFRQYMITEGQRLGATYEHIDRNPRYADVLKKLNNPENLNSQFIGDVAYDELMGASYSNKFVDQYGIFNFDAYNQFKGSLRQKYGDAVYKYILDRQAEGRKNLPPLAQEYYQAQEILKPYWAIGDRVVKLFGQGFADSSKGQSLISKMRKSMRLSNPDMERVYRKFYAS